VGVIAAPDPEYDANKWWASSSGVRTLIGETIAYLYARFLFDHQEPAVAQPSGLRQKIPAISIGKSGSYPRQAQEWAFMKTHATKKK
jgi:hypothetical protein